MNFLKMFDNPIVQNVIGTLIAAAIVAFSQLHFRKYKALSEYPKLVTSFALEICASIASLIFGITTKNSTTRVLMCVLSFAGFVGIIFMFASVLRVIASLTQLLESAHKALNKLPESNSQNGA